VWFVSILASWPERLKDANEIDVVEQQLANSVYVDEDAKRDAIARAKSN